MQKQSKYFWQRQAIVKNKINEIIGNFEIEQLEENENYQRH